MAGVEDAGFIVSKQVLRSLEYQRTTVNNDDNDDGFAPIKAVHYAYQVRNANWKKKRTDYLDY